MLVSLGLSSVRLDLGTDLVEELVHTGGAVARGDAAHTAVARIHRHLV
jgi:hypothetical protein